MLECESDLKTLYKTGLKLVNLSHDDLDCYFRIRSKLRSTYERLIVEEADFALKNNFDSKLWTECFEKPINWIEDEFEALKYNNLHLRSLRSLLVSFLDEGSTLFQLLLRLPHDKFTYNLSIYAAILLRKRENLSSSKLQARAFNLLQEAITLEPSRSLGYFVLAQWTEKDGDNLLAMYWALISCNAGADAGSDDSSAALEFLKCLSRKLSISPSFSRHGNNCDLLNGQILQMASHTILSQLTGTSHLKHVDQLSHSQVKQCANSDDLKALKYNCAILWMILGMKSSLFTHCNGEVSPIQSCLLAKLFQIHLEFIEEEAIFNIFIAFSTNPHYSTLFTGRNYETLSKINKFAFESLNKLLTRILESKKVEHVSSNVYVDYLMLKTFAELEQVNLFQYFLELNLFHRNSDGTFSLFLAHQKDKQRERSMKLLTHKFLTSQLESLEATIEPVHLPWTIPDYPALIGQFPKIKKSVQNRTIRLLITLPLLQELDLDKNKSSNCREIIRFLHERVNSSDPCIKLLEVEGDNSTISPNFRESLSQSHVNSVKQFYETESKEIIVLSSSSKMKLLLKEVCIPVELIKSRI